MIKFIMSLIAIYDLKKGNIPRFKNVHYESEYGRQYAVSAILDHLSEALENGH